MRMIDRLLLIREDVERRTIDKSDRELLSLFCSYDSVGDAPTAIEELGCRLLTLHKHSFIERRSLDPEILLNDTISDLFESGREWLERGETEFRLFTARSIGKMAQQQRRLLAAPQKQRPKLKLRAEHFAKYRERHHSPVSEAELYEQLRTIDEAFTESPEIERQVCFMRFHERKGVSLIGRELRIPRHRVVSILKCALKRLHPKLKKLSPAALTSLMILYQQSVASASGAGAVQNAAEASQGTATGGSSCVGSISGGKFGLAFTASKGASIAIASTILISVTSYFLMPKVNAVEEVGSVVSDAADKVPALEQSVAPTDAMTPVVGQSSPLPVEDPDDKANDTTEVAVLPGFPLNPKNGEKHVVQSDYLDVEFAFNFCGDRWFQQTEVTQRQWKAIQKLGGLRDNPSQFRGDDLPVTNITPEDAKAFCVAFSNHFGIPVRLPTEDEWNRAALADQEPREGDVNSPDVSPSADEVKEFAWFIGNSPNRTKPVGGLTSNPWGLHDIFGNAAELVGNEQFGYKFMGGWYCAAAFWCKPRYYGTWDGRPMAGIGMRICIDPAPQ